uniref:Uncharacterized protein n=1 Tax=Arundo donax TaxID=35708 RepID=A0A0A9G4Z4_ARUDO
MIGSRFSNVIISASIPIFRTQNYISVPALHLCNLLRKEVRCQVVSFFHFTTSR